MDIYIETRELSTFVVSGDTSFYKHFYKRFWVDKGEVLKFCSKGADEGKILESRFPYVYDITLCGVASEIVILTGLR